MKGAKPATGFTPNNVFSKNIFNSPYGFHIADRSQIAPGCRKVRLPEDNFTDDLYGHMIGMLTFFC
jgi:hypothetical protein